MAKSVVDFLRKLPPSGLKGFEGLIAELLSRLTNQQFDLAQSGSQHGRDLSSRSSQKNIIAVECKKYAEKKSFSQAELSDKIEQALDHIPDLDIWVLVTTRSVPDQLREHLKKKTDKAGIELRIIGWQSRESNQLEELCAQAQDIVLKFLEPKLSPIEKDELRQILQNITERNDYELRKSSLKDELISPVIGYYNWKEKQNNWLIDNFKSEKKSRANLRQVINITEEHVNLIERRKITQGLDDWFKSWEDKKTPFVVLGEEGYGKTWAVASWINAKITKERFFPFTIFLSAGMVDSDDPINLIAKQMEKQVSFLNLDYSKNRLNRWLKKETNYPLILLVLDGINEKHPVYLWRKIIDKLITDELATSIALVITCRTRYWDRELNSIKDYRNLKRFELQPYDDEELNSALEINNLDFRQVSEEIKNIARIPRFFDLIVEFKDKLKESKDITVARLIYEDWRQRWEKKQELPMTDREFSNLLRDLGEKYRSKIDRKEYQITDTQIKAIIPNQEQHTIINELRTSGVLIEKNGIYKVNQRYLSAGLGLLLLQEVEDAVVNGEDQQSLKQRIASWLEPKIEIEIKAEICEYATLQALLSPELENYAKVVLLTTWMESANAGKSIEKSLPAYFRENPQCYFDLAEVIWADQSDQSWAQKVLMSIFLNQLKAQEKIGLNDSIWPKVFERWLGFVHMNGFPIQRRLTGIKEQNIGPSISQRLGFELKEGSFSIAGYTFETVTQDRLLDLGEVALALISHVDHRPFVQAIVMGCLAEAIMGFPGKKEQFAWIIRTSTEPIWNEIKSEIQKILKVTGEITQKSAARLLEFIGNKEAIEIDDTLPSTLVPKNELAQEHEKDPCVSGFSWNRAECEECIKREDIAPYWIAQNLSKHCVDPTFTMVANIGVRLATLTREQFINVKEMRLYLAPTKEDVIYEMIEPSLCLYAPKETAEFVNRLVSQVSEREIFALRQLSFILKEHSLIFTNDTLDSINQTWSNIPSGKLLTDTEVDIIELNLLTALLKQWNAETQLQCILKRHEEAGDWVVFENSFKQITNWETVKELLNNRQDSITDLNRILWFISQYPKSIPTDFIDENILPLLRHKDSKIRSKSLQIIYESESQDLIEKVIKGYTNLFRKYINHDHTYEFCWGSLLLCEFGQNIPIDDLISLVHPAYWTLALKQRSHNMAETTKIIEEIDKIWENLGENSGDGVGIPRITIDTGLREPSNSNLFTINTDTSEFIPPTILTSSGSIKSQPENPNLFGTPNATHQDFEEFYQRTNTETQDVIDQQKRALNYWFAHPVVTDGLELVLHNHQEKVEKWISVIDSTESKAKKRLIYGSLFYESLCEMLLQYAPEQGIQLFEFLSKEPRFVFTRDAGMEISLLQIVVFKAPQVDVIKELWERLVSNARSDQELMSLVISAQLGKGLLWLQGYIKQNLESELPLAQMRAITLMGLTDIADYSEQFNSLLDNLPDRWLRKLTEDSLIRWKRNTWAKHWFQKFLTEDTQVKAWASFRLFLKCVDRRFWLWDKQYRNNYSNEIFKENRLQFLKDNLDDIKKNAKKNEEELEKHLYGQRIINDKSWPWMKEHAK